MRRSRRWRSKLNWGYWIITLPRKKSEPLYSDNAKEHFFTLRRCFEAYCLNDEIQKAKAIKPALEKCYESIKEQLEPVYYYALKLDEFFYRPVPRQARRGVSFCVGRYGWAGSKQGGAIDISVRWAIRLMVSCRACDNVRFVRPYLAVFGFVSGHFVLLADIFTPFPDIIRRCPQLPDRPRRSVLLAAIPCRYPVPCV